MKQIKRFPMLVLILILLIGLGLPQTACMPRYAVARNVPAHQMQVEVSFGVFHRSLSAHGHWINLGNYGPCWRPANLAIGWRPYFDNGYWAYTEYGWTWISNDPWGDIVFHYGTWEYDSFYGWIWVPGYVWSPAWVTWSYTDFYIGWAPLPPTFRFHRHHGFTGRPIVVDHHHYNFVSAEDMTVSNLHRVRVPEARNIEIVRLARAATTITVVNDHVVNHGPELPRVEKIKHMPTPIEKFSHEQRVKPKAIDFLDKQPDIEVTSPNVNREQAKVVIKDFERQERAARVERERQINQGRQNQPNINDKQEPPRVYRDKQEQIEQKRLPKQEDIKPYRIEQKQQRQQEEMLRQQRQEQRQEQRQQRQEDKMQKQQERQQNRVERKQGKNQ